MKTIKLSKRLETIAHLIPRSNNIADIGTDHGFLPIYIIQKEIVKKVYACDIAEKPLNQAKRQIQEYNVEENIELCLGPGLSPIMNETIEGIVIAGMGGSTITNILIDSSDFSKNLNFIVLQPQNNSKLVRGWLLDNGFFIKVERIIEENGFIYQIIKALKGQTKVYSSFELEYGMYELVDNKTLYKKNIEKDLNHIKNILKQMPKSNNNDIIEEKNRFNTKLNKLENYLLSLT